MNPNRLTAILGVSLAALVGSACGGPAPAMSTAPAWAAIEGNQVGGGTFNPWPGIGEVADLLPNRDYPLGPDSAWSHSDAVVRGQVTAVGPGSAFRLTMDESTGRQLPSERLSYDDPTATWRTVLVTVEIDEVLGRADIDVPEKVVVRFTADGGKVDLDVIFAPYQALDQAVFFLSGHSEGMEPDPSVFGLAYSGATTMVVDTDGRLVLPFFSDELVAIAPQAPGPSGRVKLDITLDELRKLAAQEPRPASNVTDVESLKPHEG